MSSGVTEQDMVVSTGKIPWWGLGVRRDTLMTVEEALTAEDEQGRNLDWEVVKKPLLVDHGDGQMNYLNDWVATVRSSDGLPLGAVKPNYTPASNRELAEFMAAVLDVLGTERAIETAGSLFGGKVVWFLFQVPKVIDLKDGGKIAPYAVIASSHNATLKNTLKITPTRIECANTLDMAIHGAGNVYGFKHTRDWKGNIIQAQEMLGLTFKYLDEFEKTAKDLMRQRMTYKDMVAFTEVLFPSTADPDQVPTRTQNRRDGVLAMLHTDNLANIKTTAWGAYNAVAEFVDHHGTFRETEGGSREDNRALSIFTGQASLLKDQALKILLAEKGR